MVVIGILIALGLEGVIQRHHDQQVAGRAELEMVAEIPDNQAQITHVIADLDNARPELQGLVASQKAAIDAQRNHQTPTAEAPPPSNAPLFPTLSSAAWDSALAMQAVGRIDMKTARELARIYSDQRDVKAAQQIFLQVAQRLNSFAGREANDTRERMFERLGALTELNSSLDSLLSDYHELLSQYDKFLNAHAEFNIT